MAKTVIVGAGFSGHYAALILQNELEKKGDHDITVVNLYPKFTYIPSLVWVGIGQITPDKAQFDLQPVYDKLGIEFILGRAKSVHPDDNYLVVETENDSVRVDYDYMIMATGPKLEFEATPGLGPEGGYTNSICTPPHATATAQKYLDLVKRLEKGENAKMVIGLGHGMCTCQGAAFEYISLVHNDLVDRGVRDRVELTWLSNEPRAGDFGIDGFEMRKGPVIFTAEDMATALFEDYGIDAILNSHVHKVEERTIHYENIEGEHKTLEFDFSMLIPRFQGQPIEYLDKDGNNIRDRMCNPAGFVKVDGKYGKPYAEISADDWPKTYQSPEYANIFAAGIAFAPPGTMSKPSKTAGGAELFPAIPRTGYTSELTGKAAALNVADMIEGRSPSHTSSLAETPGMCVASLKNSWLKGSAATIGLQPIVRNRGVFPEHGRAVDMSAVEVGLAGAWMKKGLHYAFLYKLQAKPFWKSIP
jgi:sulfide:quinone oxidoreductase